MKLIIIVILIVFLLLITFFHSKSIDNLYRIIETKRKTSVLMSKRIDILDKEMAIIKKELDIKIEWNVDLEKMEKK